MNKLFLLKDWTAPDKTVCKAGTILTTTDEDEAKDLLFKGITRLATEDDEKMKDPLGFDSPEDLGKFISQEVGKAVAAAAKSQAPPGGKDVEKIPAQAKDNSPGPYKSFAQQLADVVEIGSPGGVNADTVKRLGQVKAITGMSESVPADGGFLVQTDFAAELLRKTHETGLLASRCRQQPISSSSNAIKINALNETSRATGSRLGGIRGYWGDEAGEKTASKPKFRQIELSLRKLHGLCYATDELLADAVALETLMRDGFAEEFGFLIDEAIINGAGAVDPLGIMNGGSIVSVGKEIGQAATTFVAKNAEAMYSRLWSRSMSNTVWLINQDVWPQIFQFSHTVGAGGVSMFIPAGTISSAPFGTLLGRPILPIEQCQTLGTTGDVILADFSQYILATKGTLESAVSIHVRFIYDETVFRFVLRIDGQPIWNAALTPYKGAANTVSPFVKLDVRS